MSEQRAKGRTLMAISADLKGRGFDLSHMGVKRTLIAAERSTA
jgi:hypothetical protein